MKRAKSDLIDAFLLNVEKGYITSLEHSSGPVILKKIADAFQAILDGEKPDKALEVERKKGNPPDPINLKLAFLMHEHLKDGATWTIAENVASNYQLSQGRVKKDLLTHERLKQIDKHNLKAIQLYEDVGKPIRKQKKFNAPEIQ